MNCNYADAAKKLPHESMAIGLCEMAGIDLDLVQTVDVHSHVLGWPVVTFTSPPLPTKVARYELHQDELRPLSDGWEDASDE